MQNLRLIITASAGFAFILVLSTNAVAQSTRTWVSSTGNDANMCTRIAPCRTFAGAFVKTSINGEINCLDPDSYGTVTITKSITIDCEDTQGAITSSSAGAIIVNLGAASSNDPLRIVRVRGLTMNGQRAAVRGILVASANTAPTTLHVEQLVIEGFSDGILFNPAGGELQVRNSIIRDCSAHGLMVDSAVGGQVVRAALDSSTFSHNAEGIRVETNSFVTATNCDISSNSLDGAIVELQEGFISHLNLLSCLIASNGHAGVSVIDAFGLATVRLDANHIVNNSGAGVFNAATFVLTRGNNTISGNSVDIQGKALTPMPSS